MGFTWDLLDEILHSTFKKDGLEDEFPFGIRPIFRWELLVSGREPRWKP